MGGNERECVIMGREETSSGPLRSKEVEEMDGDIEVRRINYFFLSAYFLVCVSWRVC